VQQQDPARFSDQVSALTVEGLHPQESACVQLGHRVVVIRVPRGRQCEEHLIPDQPGGYQEGESEYKPISSRGLHGAGE
jgi:hypothetical protein